MHPKRKRLYAIQFSLFVATLITTTLAGAEWMYGRPFYYPNLSMGWDEFIKGLQFSIPFLGILTIHEFGHYFTAKKHKTRVSLPYYIPFWLGPLGLTGIGTAGAFIRIKQRLKSRIKFFDIGIAGPLAGFIAALGVLWYAFAFLPPADYIFQIHPEYKQFGLDYFNYVYKNNNPDGILGAFNLGDSLLFNWFKDTFANPALIPHPNEMTHYPFILAGHLALFFTSLNLMPIGQLDGGHILYGLIGDKAFNRVSPVFFLIFLFYSGLGFFSVNEFYTATNEEFNYLLIKLLGYFYFVYLCCSRITDVSQTNALIGTTVVLVQLGISELYPDIKGYEGFLLFAFILGRFLGIYHPPTKDEQPLSLGRKILGWLALIIFVLCFSPKPFVLV